MNIPDHSLETVFWVKILQSLLRMRVADSGSGNLLALDPGPGLKKFGSRLWVKKGTGHRPRRQMSYGYMGCGAMDILGTILLVE
jgi:hypothetical protein